MKREKAAVSRMIPTTANSLLEIFEAFRGSAGEKLTIELDEVVKEALEVGTVGLDLLEHTSLLGLALHEEHDGGGRGADTEHDDGESTEGPAEVEVGVEQVGDLGTGEDDDDVRGAVDAEHDHTVLEGGHIGDHDVEDEQHTKVTDVVDGVGGDVGFHVLADGLHHDTDARAENHDQEGLRATPDVHDLGDGDLATS